MTSYPEISPSPQHPTFLLIPLRPLVSVITVLSTGYNGLLIYECLKEREYLIWIAPLIACILDVLPLIGIVTNQLSLLKWSRGFVALSVLYAIVNFCIWPVFVSSSVSHQDNELLNFISNVFDKKQSAKFATELKMGYITEGLIGFGVIVQIFKFYLINGLYKSKDIADNVSFDTIYDL